MVFTSEHGDMLGDHYMLHKNTMYEESARVPLIIHVPWLSKDQELLSGPVSQIDLVPTLLDLLGQPIPPGLEGQSLAPGAQRRSDLGGERRRHPVGTGPTTGRSDGTVGCCRGIGFGRSASRQDGPSSPATAGS